MKVADRPALGAVVERPDVQRRRALAVIEMRGSLNDHLARARFMKRVGDMQWSAQHGALWERMASDLRDLADAAERVPQRLLVLVAGTGSTAGTAAAESEAA